jgi:uncharacterized protein YneF (UPF0154 family)
MGKIIGFFIVLLIIVTIVFGGWWLERKIHYKLFYKNMVEQTVRDMVKKECLK